MSRAANDLIMVVDDDGDTRDALREVLSRFGYSTLLAADGEHALDLLRSAGVERPCVILVDLWMPKMDGWQFCAAHRADSSLREIPIIVVSADVKAESRIDDLGGVAFVT